MAICTITFIKGTKFLHNLLKTIINVSLMTSESRCSVAPCDVCGKGECFGCNIGSRCGFKTYITRQCTNVCKDPQRVDKYDVAYVVHIKNLERLRVRLGFYVAL